METYKKIVFVIAVIGAVAGFGSCIMTAASGSFLSAAIFGLCGLSCTASAVRVHDHRKP